MNNDIFAMLSSMLAAHLGRASPLESGTGARFQSAHRGKATVYHRNIAPGNLAEVAFDVESMASHLNITAAEFRSLVGQLQTATGRPVEINPRYKWPRVGVTSEAHIALIHNALTGAPVLPT